MVGIQHFIELGLSFTSLVIVLMFLVSVSFQKERFYSILNNRKKGLLVIIFSFAVYIFLEIFELFKIEIIEYGLQTVIFLIWIIVFSYYFYNMR